MVNPLSNQSKANAQGTVHFQYFSKSAAQVQFRHTGLVHTIYGFTKGCGRKMGGIDVHMCWKGAFPFGCSQIHHFNDGGMLIADVV